jgi:glycosyltransferase involved in cell wall biosynthesis
MRVIVASVRTPFVHGGAEVHAAQLLAALKAEGHTADLVEMPFNPEPELIPDQMLACGLLDLTNIHETPVDRLIALKFPAYLIPHPHKVVWLLHQHRAAYDLYENADGGLADTPRGRILRDIIRRADEQIGVEARAIFTNSRNVTRRLQEFSGTPSVPLYHPPAGAEEFYCADEAGDYFFFPSRLTATKRQELVIEALGLTSSPVRIKFSGVPDSVPYGEHLLRLATERRVADRIEWLGFLPESEKRHLYARALAVVFPPLDEDYGYVTLEAMLSSKAVITCTDSGGPLEFVVPEKTGLVTAPTAAALARAMDTLWQNRALAQTFGRAGRRRYEEMDITWSHVVKTLLE